MRSVVVALLFALAFAASPRPSRAQVGVHAAPVVLPEKDHLGFALYGRGLFLPRGVLAPFLSASTELHSGSIGASFIKRRGPVDVVVSLDFSWFNLPPGNFLAGGKDPVKDTHWTEFRDFHVLSADVSLYYNKQLAPWLFLSVGGGFGLGYLFGEVWIINNSNAVCTAENYADPSKCYPIADPGKYQAWKNPVPQYEGANLSGPVKFDDPEFQGKLTALAASLDECAARRAMTGMGDCRDTAEHPYWRRPEKIPVVPVFNLQVGFKFRITREFHWNLMAGLRNGIVVGGGPEFVF